MASLALERLRQDGRLRVRQREQLRRALSTAADALGWTSKPGSDTDKVKAATKDVAKLADGGARSLEQDIVDQLAEKRTEMQRLKKVASSLLELADDPDTVYPAEVEYTHTARDGSRGLATKTETFVLNDAGEARTAANSLENKLESYTKLRDQMIEDLKHRQRQVAEMRQELPGFVESSNGLVAEVIATLTY